MLEMIDGVGDVVKMMSVLAKLEEEGREVRQLVARRIGRVWGWSIVVTVKEH